MEPSNWIEIISIIVNSILSIIAIVISVKTLKKTSESIEESSRPYITVSRETVLIDQPRDYFVLKNYGNSGALITDIIYDSNLKNLKYGTTSIKNPFEYFVGSFLAPGQKLVSCFDVSAIPADSLKFIVKYEIGSKTYSTESVINLNQTVGVLRPVIDPKGKELSTISRVFQEYLVKSF